jgi:hypothetical protein
MMHPHMQLKTTHPHWADEKYVTRNYGITHTPLFNLRKSGAIRSLALRAEGAKYGKRLYSIPSIEAYLARCEMREKTGAGNEGGKLSTTPSSTPPAEPLPPELEEQIEALRSRFFEEQAAMLEEVEA